MKALLKEILFLTVYISSQKGKISFLFFALCILAVIVGTFHPRFQKADAAISCPAISQEPLSTIPEKNDLIESVQALEKAHTALKSALQNYGNGQENQIPALTTLLSERKKYLNKVYRTNPEKAFSYVLSDQEIEQISSFSERCVEKPVTLAGRLEIFHADYKKERVSKTLYKLTTSTAEVFLHPSISSRPLLSGMKVKVTGYQLDSDMVFENDQLTILQDVPVDTLGVQNAVVLMVNFQNTAQPGLTQQQMQNIVFTQTNNYYQEVSYHKTSLAGTVIDWRVIPVNQTCDLGTVQSQAIQSVDPFIDFRQYGRLIIVFPFSGCAGSGFGTIGKVLVTTADGIVNMSVSWDDANSMELDLVAHELGHNFGTAHANFLNCGTVTIRLNIADCIHVEYGDIYDVMGFGGPTGHMNAIHKEYLNWFDPSNIQIASISGIYVLEPIENTSPGIKVLKVPRAGGEYLYLEYRQPIGEDTRLQSLSSDVFEGALLHRGTFGTHLLDASPPADNLTPALKAGSLFTDPQTNNRIEVLGKTTSALTIRVTIPTVCTVPILCAAPPPGCEYQGATSCSCGTLVCSGSGSPAPNPTPTPTATFAPESPAAPSQVFAQTVSCLGDTAYVLVLWKDNAQNELGFRVFKQQAGDPPEGVWTDLLPKPDLTFYIWDAFKPNTSANIMVVSYNNRGFNASQIVSVPIECL